MNTWTNQNQSSYYRPDKAALEAEARVFWPSENGIAAHKKLLSDLAEGPILLADLGGFARDYGIIVQKVPHKLKIFLCDSQSGVEIRQDDKKADWCGLKGKDETYWAAINSPSKKEARIEYVKIERFPDFISNITLGMHFFGNFNLSRAVNTLGKPIPIVRNIQLESGDIPSTDTVEVSSASSDYAPSGGFVVGYCNKLGALFLEDYSKKAFMIRNWKHFKESETFQTFDEFLCKTDTHAITPLFSTKYDNILIYDEGKLYAGLDAENLDRGIIANKVIVSNDVFTDLQAIKNAGFFLYKGGNEVKFAGDAFLLAIRKGNNWRFLEDSTFWQEWEPKPTGEEASVDEDKPTGEVTQANEDRPTGEEASVDEDKPTDEVTPVDEDSPQRISWNTSEIAFLDNFKQYVTQCGFKYEDRDLARFHTSVKCGMLTLLGGEPGTGKSSLVELYFRALGGSDSNRESEDSFLRVDVNPSWMEPADLIGFRDQNNHFRPAENGLFNRLQKWNDEDGGRNHLWAICLEEINLACVEHYFSDFIQIISRGNGCLKYERKVSSDDSPNADASEMQCSDGDIAPEECAIRLTDNLRFVGTCNSDETTRSLSLRFLDRCNMIELSLSDEMKERLLVDAFAGRTAKVLPYELEQGHEVSANDFQEWTNHDAGNLEEVKKLLSGLMASFEKAGIAPSPRVIAEIANYIRNRPPWGIGDGMSSEQDRFLCALDECMAQRILSRYKASPGTIAGLEELKSHLETQEHHMALSCNMISTISQEYQKNMAFIG